MSVKKQMRLKKNLQAIQHYKMKTLQSKFKVKFREILNSDSLLCHHFYSLWLREV